MLDPSRGVRAPQRRDGGLDDLHLRHVSVQRQSGRRILPLGQPAHRRVVPALLVGPACRPRHPGPAPAPRAGTRCAARRAPLAAPPLTQRHRPRPPARHTGPMTCRLVALGDSTVEGLMDPGPDGAYVGWADRFARAPGPRAPRPALRQPRGPRTDHPGGPRHPARAGARPRPGRRAAGRRRQRPAPSAAGPAGLRDNLLTMYAAAARLRRARADLHHARHDPGRALVVRAAAADRVPQRGGPGGGCDVRDGGRGLRRGAGRRPPGAVARRPAARQQRGAPADRRGPRPGLRAAGRGLARRARARAPRPACCGSSGARPPGSPAT